MPKITFLKNSTALSALLILIVVKTFSQDIKHLKRFMQVAPSPANESPFGNNPNAGHYIHTGDARIYYEVYGKGKTIVILHGGVFGSTYEMAQFIDSLSKNYQVIAVSTRGHGKSEMGTGLPTYEQKAMDVSTIIQAVTKDSVTVLGFSDGAYTGYFLAAIYPSKVKRLITIGAGEWSKGARTFNLNSKMAFSMDSVYWKQQRALMPEPQKIDHWFSSLNQYYNSVVVGKEIFGKLHCPVLMMAGERDQNAPLKSVIAAYYMIPNARLSIIPNAPHTAFLTNFPAVWAGIVPFIKQ